MMKTRLFNFKAEGGARQFARVPETMTWPDLLSQLQTVPGLTVGNSSIDNTAEAWIEFSYRGHSFKVNNQFGDYGFFVQDPSCPDEILLEVVNHCGNEVS